MRVALCPAEQYGVIESEMRRDAAAGLDIIDFEAARDWPCSILACSSAYASPIEVSSPKTASGPVAGAHVQRVARPEDVARVARLEAANPRASWSLAVRKAEDASAAGNRIPIDRRVGSRDERRAHRDLYFLSGRPGDALQAPDLPA